MRSLRFCYNTTSDRESLIVIDIFLVTRSACLPNKGPIGGHMEMKGRSLATVNCASDLRAYLPNKFRRLKDHAVASEHLNLKSLMAGYLLPSHHA
jgi:hypothetical protein